MILNEYILALGAIPFLFKGKLKRTLSIAVLSLLSILFGCIAICSITAINIENTPLQSLAISPVGAIFSLLFCLSIVPTLLVEEHRESKDELNLSVFYSGAILLLTSLHGLLQTTIGSGVWGFIFYWELIALSSFMVMAQVFHKRENFHSAILYFVTMHLCLFFILGGFASMGDEASGGTLFGTGDMPLVSWLLLAIGFGLKSAIFPFSFWLPRAYSTASSTGAALMSCTSTNIGIYGLYMATLNVGSIHAASVTLITVGTITALLGIFRIIRTGRLNTLLSFSSVESLGIVVFALGFSFYAREHGQNLISIMALTSALLRLFSHGVAKSLLLSIAGAVCTTAGSDKISELREHCRRRPILSRGFFIGAMSLSSAPIFGSFVGEFLLFFALISGIGVAAISTISLIGVVILALCSTSVAFAMIKAFGIGFLGVQRVMNAQKSTSRTRRAVGYVIFATVLCLGVWTLAYAILNNTQHFFLITSQNIDTLWRTLLNLGLVALLIVGVSTLMWYIRRLLTKKAEVRKTLSWECGYDDSHNSQCSTLPTAESYSNEALNLFSIPIQDKAKESQRKVQQRIAPLRVMRRWTSRLALFHTGQVSHYVAHILWFLALVLILTLFNVL